MNYDQINGPRDAEANRQRLQACADQHLVDVAVVARPDDQEVIDLLAVTYDMTGEEVIAMLAAIDLDAARVRNEVAE